MEFETKRPSPPTAARSPTVPEGRCRSCGRFGAGRAARKGARRTGEDQRQIVIAGAGAGGISTASKLARLTEGAQITIIDAREEHYFQPGYTLVGSGVWQPGQVISTNAEYLPREVKWIRSAVADFNPNANEVVTAAGQKVAYDFLIVATGLSLDYSAIQGMDEKLIGREGIASIYAGPEPAAAYDAQCRPLSKQAARGCSGVRRRR